MEIKLLESKEEKNILRMQQEELSDFVPFFSTDVIEHRIYLAAVLEKKIVGMVCLVRDSRRVPGALGVAYVSVHSQYRNRGIARSLVSALFELAERRRQDIANTVYEPDGELWLKPLMQAKAQQTATVRLHER